VFLKACLERPWKEVLTVPDNLEIPMTLAEPTLRQDDIYFYTYPGTRAKRVHWTLEELQLTYILVNVALNEGAHKRDDYLAIHPLGKVPALTIGGQTLIESMAIVTYLADRYPEQGLAPTINSPLRADYCQWMAFAVATLEPAVMEAIRSAKLTHEERQLADLGPAQTSFESAMGYLTRTLAKRSFLVGKQFSLADLMVGSVLIWADGNDLLSEYPRMQKWLETLKQRPAYQIVQCVQP